MRRGLFLLLFKRHSSAKSVDHYGHSIFLAVFTKCWTFQPRQLLRTFQPWALSSSIPYTLPRQYVNKRHNKCVNFLQVSSLATNSHFTGKGKLTYLYQCMHCTHTHIQKKKKKVCAAWISWICTTQILHTDVLPIFCFYVTKFSNAWKKTFLPTTGTQSLLYPIEICSLFTFPRSYLDAGSVSDLATQMSIVLCTAYLSVSIVTGLRISRLLLHAHLHLLPLCLWSRLRGSWFLCWLLRLFSLGAGAGLWALWHACASSTIAKHVGIPAPHATSGTAPASTTPVAVTVTLGLLASMVNFIGHINAWKHIKIFSTLSFHPCAIFAKEKSDKERRTLFNKWPTKERCHSRQKYCYASFLVFHVMVNQCNANILLTLCELLQCWMKQSHCNTL